MIPHRVKLEGFLCYKEPREICFSGASLWMLSGANGSGKSSVFDAITFALFGHHRGGAQNAKELIHKEANALVVEFEFFLGNQLYQAKRTLRRGGHSTYQISRRDGQDHSGSDRWQPIEDTNSAAGYNRWIAENIGLNYETFTSSVLLLQGRAERLLNSTPRERFDTLARIVDLERYRRIHERAEAERRAYKERLSQAKGALAGIPEVTDEQLADALQAIESARQRREQTQAQIASYQQLQQQAVEWSTLHQHIAGLVQRWEQLDQLLRSAEQINRDYARLLELTQVLPPLKEIIVQRAALDEARRQSETLNRQLRDQQEKRQHLDEALSQKRELLTSYKEQLGQQENQITQRRQELAESQRNVDRLNRYEQLQQQLQQLQAQAQKYPPDNQQTIARLQREVDELQSLDGVLYQLREFANTRATLREQSAQLTKAESAMQQSKSDGEKVRAECDQLKARLDEQSRNLQSAVDTVTELRARHQQAQKACEDLESLEGDKTCRYCGQPLTPEHLQQERTRRREEREALAQELAVAREKQQQAQQAVAQTTSQLNEVERRLQQLREDYRGHKTSADLLRKQVDSLQQTAHEQYGRLPDDYQHRIGETLPADVTSTTYPTPVDLESLQARLKTLAGIRQQLQQARVHQQKLDQINGQITAVNQSLSQVQRELPPDQPERIRQRFDELTVAVRSLEQRIQTLKKNIATTEQDLDKHRNDLAKLEQAIQATRGQLDVQATKRQHAESQLNHVKNSLPAPWHAQLDQLGTSSLHTLEVERDQLIANRTEEQYKQIEPARAGRESLRQQIEEARKRLDGFPKQAQQQPATIDRLIRQAQQALEAYDHEWGEATMHHGVLVQQQRRRRELLQEIATLEQELNWYKLLAELLGRERLQRHLIRRAERQIIDHANAALDRLSGGQLYLRLVSQDSDGNDHALDLQAFNRVTGEQPINVTYLSGSQRFRVAVALALGIGQYASKQHRPIESVIIDEGFGCLDRTGRQVMIQELQNLRDNMKCILLVSHQEDIAEAFPDGYHFEMVNGTTCVTRISR